MDPGEALAVVLGLAMAAAVIVLPVIALVLARRARDEAERLRNEVTRLSRLLHERTDGLTGRPPAEPVAPDPFKAAYEATRAAAPQAPSPPAPTAPAPPPAAPPEPPVPPRFPELRPHARPEVESLPVEGIRESREPVSFEAYLGGKVFLVAGVVTALLGLGWFFKVAIDRNWIGPGVRVLIGAAAGAAALAVGDRLRARGFALFGHGLMGGGLGALFVTDYFASVRYGFLDRPEAFGVAGLLAAGGAALALFREAPLLAYLGFVGGFLAPGMLSRGEDRLWGHALWLAVLDAGVLWTASRRRWHGLELSAVLASAAYFSSWTGRYLADGRIGEASAVLALLAGMGLATALVPPILRRDAPAGTALFAAFLVGLFGVIGGAEILYPDHRRALGAGIAGLAAAYLAAARLVGARSGEKGAAGAILAMAMAAFAASIPFVFEGRAVSPVWAATGLALVVVAARGAPDLLAAGGAGMILLGAAESIVMDRWSHEPGFTPLLNPAFVAAAAPAAALLVAAAVLGRRSREGLAPFLRVAGSWLLAAVLGSEAAASVADGLGDGLRHHGELKWAAAAAAVAASVFASAAAARREGDGVRGALLVPAIPAMLLGLRAVLGGWSGAFDPVFNAPFAFGIAVVVSFVAAGAFSPAAAGRVIQVGGIVFLLALATGEIYSWGAWCPVDEGGRQDALFRAQVVVSVAWAVYASALLVAGFARDRADVRWCGILLFAATAAKVFLYDMAALDVVYRIGSFLVLGLLLVGASFLYQKKRREVGDARAGPERPAATEL